MNQEQIKEWLTWFIENIDKAFIYSASKQTYYEYEFEEEAKTIAYSYDDEPIKLDRILQLAIQEEIAKQKDWTLEINLLLSGIATCAIRRIVDGIVKEKFYHEAETTLQAMMLAFREAWQVTHD